MSDDIHAQRAALRAAGGSCGHPPSAFVDRCTELDRTGSRGDAFHAVAVLSYATSSAVAVAAVTYALWPHARAASAGRVRALPELRASGAGMNVVGTW